MRKLFSILAAVLFAGSMMASYNANQVTSVKAGGKYVFERNDRVLIGTVSSSKLQTTNEYVTTSLVGDEAYVWTLETAEGGFYLKQGEKYLKNGSGTSVSLVNEGGSVWAFAFTDGVALISNKSNSDRYIGETSAGSNEYKAYSTQNMDYGHDFKVYELVSGEGGGEGGGTGEATELTFEAAGATFDDGGAGFATWTLDLFNNEMDYPEVIVTVYAKEVDKIAGTYQASEIKEIALQLSATESGYYFANSPSASTISNISDLQINYMNNGVYKYTMSSFEFNGQTYKFDADLATTGDLHDGSDQGGSGEGGEGGEGGETGEDITMSITIGSVHYDDEGDYGTWTFNLYNGNDDHFIPGVLITVRAIANNKIASTYGADDIFSVIANLAANQPGEQIDNFEDLKVSYLSNNTYKFEFKFTAESGQKYIINASLVIDDSSLRDGTDQGGSGEGGEGGETPGINETHTLEVSFCEARLVEENTLHGNQSTWEFILYNEMEGESAFAAPNARVLVYAKSKTSIAGTYAANTAIIEMSGTPMAGSPAYATTWSDVKISYRGENRYSFKFDFVGSVGSLFDEFIVNRIVEVSAKNADNSEAIQLDESATAISNTETVVKAVKTIKDGQLIIERNGVNYNANGQIVR